MTEDESKIKELFDCEYVVSDEALYPLQEWYNSLIDKTISELTISDILRMLRQNVFTNLAMQKAVEILQKNVFAGELYDGQLLEKISEVDTKFVKTFIEELNLIVKDAVCKSETHEWTYEGEKEEFFEVVNAVLEKCILDSDYPVE